MHFSHFHREQAFYLELTRKGACNHTLVNCNKVGDLIRQNGFRHNWVKTLDHLVWISRLNFLHNKFRDANRNLTYRTNVVFFGKKFSV